MGTTDSRGNSHRSAGIPGAGRFDVKRNSRAAGTDQLHEARVLDDVLTAAKDAGRIGSRRPTGSHPHLDQIRRSLWWALHYRGDSIRTPEELRSELDDIAALEDSFRHLPDELASLRSARNTIRWVLGETDELYPD